MNPFVRFFTRMDASVWRTMLVTGVLLASVLAVLVFGKLFLFHGDDSGVFGQIRTLLEHTTGTPLGLILGLLILILLYCVSSFVGAPQFGLIGVTVLVFGPVIGFIYSWIATMVSAVMAFYIGRAFGMNMVRKYGGESISKLSRFMRKNDFLASAIVRNVPTAPAIVVNMAFGASEARFLWFFIGCGVGIVPKILIIALFGEAVAQSMTGNPVFAFIAVFTMAVIWIPVMLVSRSNIRKEKRQSDKAASLEETNAEY